MDMIERVARALCEDNCDNWDAKDFRETPSGESPREMRDGYIGLAITAIKAMRDCTQGVVEAGVFALSDNGVNEANLDDAKFCYSAMIEAALGEHA